MLSHQETSLLTIYDKNVLLKTQAVSHSHSHTHSYTQTYTHGLELRHAYKEFNIGEKAIHLDTCYYYYLIQAIRTLVKQSSISVAHGKITQHHNECT